MINKKYTNQEIKDIFFKQAKTIRDIYYIKLTIKCYGLELVKQVCEDIYFIEEVNYSRYEPTIIKQGSKFEQAKTGKDIYDIINTIDIFKLKITEQAAEFEQAKTGRDIYYIARVIDFWGLKIVKQAAKDEKAKTGRDIYNISMNFLKYLI